MNHHELGSEMNWTCGYSPDGPLECLDVATVHGFRLTDDGLNIASMMASCEEHRAQMRADYEHPTRLVPAREGWAQAIEALRAEAAQEFFEADAHEDKSHFITAAECREEARRYTFAADYLTDRAAALTEETSRD